MNLEGARFSPKQVWVRRRAWAAGSAAPRPWLPGEDHGAAGIWRMVQSKRTRTEGKLRPGAGRVTVRGQGERVSEPPEPLSPPLAPIALGSHLTRVWTRA